MISVGNLTRLGICLMVMAFNGLITKGVYGQSISLEEGRIFEIKKTMGLDNIREVGYTASLIRGDDYKNIKEKISLLKNKGPKEKISELEIGDEKEFFVRNIITGDTWNSLPAVLSYHKAGINIWIQKSAYDTLIGTPVLHSILQGFEERLYQSTLRNSISPTKGVLNILNQYVGDFPDVDNDQVLDVLLLDIQDNFNVTGSYVAGFFDPVNLYEFEYSNQRDLIYLDLYPTIIFDGNIHVERAVSTFAHESQHLIHANYEGEKPELVFVNEGFSEVVEILCGFEPRSAQGFKRDPLRGLVEWNYENPIPDYSRASLWMHYLVEQLGPVSLKDFVQNPEIGIHGYKEVIEDHSSFTFDQVFQNWGLAMLINDTSQNPAYGYKHELIRGLILNKKLSFNNLPGIFNGELPRYVNLPVHFSLTEELEFTSGTPSVNNIWVSSVSKYPNQSEKEVRVNNESSISADAKNAEYGSIDILVSNFGTESSDSVSLSFVGDGNPSGTEIKTSFGDAKPDKFYMNASYLSLDETHEKLAVIFPPEESTYWLKDFKIWTLFKSELVGSGVDGNVERDFSVNIYSVLNGKPDQSLISPIVFEVKRELGKLVDEIFSLADYYDQLSVIEDTLMIIIGNDAGDENYIALGLDEGTVNATLFSEEAGIENGWEKLSEKSIGGTSLSNWNPAIEVSTVLPEVEERNISAIGDIAYGFNQVSVSTKPLFNYDSSSVSMAARLPDGSFKSGELIFNETDEFTYSFPVMVDGSYTFINRYESPDGKITYRDEEKWSIDIPSGFSVSDNYPNPFNPTTTVPFMLLEKASIHWEVFDVMGRLVLSIPAREFGSGQHSQIIDLRNQASGMYFVRARLSRERSNTTKYITQKIMLIK